MKTVVRLSFAAAAGFLGGLMADYFKKRRKPPREEPSEEYLLLEDASAIAAPHSLSLLEERPDFALDERQRPYATMNDVDDVRRKRVSDKPSLLEEPEPNRSG